jgi:hypothetical protein
MFSGLRSTAGVALLVGALATALLCGVAAAHRGAAGLATVTITSPIGTATAPQTVDQSGGFTITIVVQNFTLDAKDLGSKVNRAGFGHYHVYVDTFDPTSPFRYWVLAGASTTIHVSLAALAKAGVTSGVHKLHVVLANNDHSVLIPLAFATTVVRVVPPPGIAITTPVGTITNPQLVGPTRMFAFTVAPRNFRFDATRIGSKTNRPGFGHYHIYVDRIDPTTPFNYWIQAGATTDVKVGLDALAKAGFSAGTHTLFVALANNDHSLLRPLAVASTVIRLGPSIQVAEMAAPAPPLVLAADGTITLHISVGGFRLDPAGYGKAPSPGSGHYHLYIDSFDPAHPFVNYVGWGAGPTVELTGAALLKAKVKPGGHALYVLLANNDHTLVTPYVGASSLVVFAG